MWKSLLDGLFIYTAEYGEIRIRKAVPPFYTPKLRLNNPIWIVQSIFVQEEYREKGIGNDLLDQAVLKIKTLEPHNVYLGLMGQVCKEKPPSSEGAVALWDSYLVRSKEASIEGLLIISIG